MALWHAYISYQMGNMIGKSIVGSNVLVGRTEGYRGAIF